MKAFASLVLAAALLAPAALFADDDPGRDARFSLTVYPFPALVGLYSLEGEAALTEHISLAVEFKYLHWDLDYEWLGGGWELSLFMLGPGLRYYTSRAMRGFFIGPYVSYLSTDLTYTDEDSGDSGEASQNGYNIALWLGYKLVVKSVIIEISTGVSYASLDPEVTYTNSSGQSVSQSFDLGLGGLYWPGIGFGIGIAF
mgnify:FL=1